MTTLTIPTSELGYDYDIELHSWVNKLSGYRVFSDTKLPMDGGLGIGLNFITQYDYDGSWIDKIPKHYLEIIAPFPEYQYHLLWLAANSASAAQLLESRPLLLVLTCHRYHLDSDKALQISRMGQREILKTLGFDGSKAALKFLDKLDLSYEVGNEIEHIINQLGVRDRRYLKFKHYPQINYAALILDHVHPFVTGTRLGISMAKQQRLSSKLAYFQDALMLGQHLGIEDPISHIVQQPSIDAFHQLHNRWADMRNLRTYNKQAKPDDADVPYPSLLKGNELIKPITNYEKLSEEGREQRNCISVYHARIASEQYCVFRMLKPERLTIGIRCLPQGRFPFEIDQIAGVRNSQPSEESRQIIRLWFERCRQEWILINTST